MSPPVALRRACRGWRSDAGRYEPRVAANAFACAIVRLAEAFLYNDAIVGIRGDTYRLREIEAALLGVD